MKKYLCLLVLLFGSLSPLITVVGDQGYWLHTYMNKDQPSPGDAITLITEMFRKGKHVTENFQLKIQIFNVAHETNEKEMIRQRAGVYTYEFTLLSSFDKSYIDILVTAYDGEETIASVHQTFITDVEPDVDTEINPTTGSSLYSIMPGDVVWVITHVPAQQLFGLSSAEIDIEPKIFIYDLTSWEILYETNNTEVVTTDLGEGFYKTTWYFPLDLLDNTSSSCSVNVIVIVRYQGEEYETSFSIPIWRCNLLIRGTIHNYSSARISVLALDSNNDPLADINFNLTIRLYIEDQGYIDKISVYPTPTDSSGQTSIEMDFTQLIGNKKITSLGVEAETLSERFYVSRYTYIETFDAYNPFNNLYFSYSDNIYRYLFQYYNKGVWLEFQLINGTNIISNKEVYVYCGKSLGIYKNYVIRSDSNGILRIKIDWPSNIKVGQRIYLGLYTTLDDKEWTTFSTSFTYNPDFIHVNENPFPEIVKITEYSTYKVYELEWSIPEHLRNKSLTISSNSNILVSRKSNSSLFNYNSRTMYPINDLEENVSIKIIVDSEFPINYLEIMVMDSKNYYLNPETGGLYYIWFLDAEGKGLTLPKENVLSAVIQSFFSNEAMNLYPRLIIFGTIILVIFVLWKRHHSKI